MYAIRLAQSFITPERGLYLLSTRVGLSAFSHRSVFPDKRIAVRTWTCGVNLVRGKVRPVPPRSPLRGCSRARSSCSPSGCYAPSRTRPAGHRRGRKERGQSRRRPFQPPHPQTARISSNGASVISPLPVQQHAVQACEAAFRTPQTHRGRGAPAAEYLPRAAREFACGRYAQFEDLWLRHKEIHAVEALQPRAAPSGRAAPHMRTVSERCRW